MQDRRDQRWWQLALTVALCTFSAVVAVGLAGSLGIFIWKNPQRGRTLVEILRVFVSWPLVVGVVGGAFLWYFRVEIRKFLGDMRMLRTPWGSLEREQGAVGGDVEPARPEQAPQPQPTDEQREAIATFVNMVANDAAQAQQAIAALQGQLAQKHREAVHWWVMFLDRFLVPHTKYTLRMLAAMPMTRGEFIRFFAPSIPSESEREAVIDALLGQQLVQVGPENRQLVPSPAGQAYLRWLDTGFLPVD